MTVSHNAYYRTTQVLGKNLNVEIYKMKLKEIELLYRKVVTE